MVIVCGRCRRRRKWLTHFRVGGNYVCGPCLAALAHPDPKKGKSMTDAHYSSDRSAQEIVSLRRTVKLLSDALSGILARAPQDYLCDLHYDITMTGSDLGKIQQVLKDVETVM